MRQEERAALEPIVAHGSRMSWAGIFRPGDEFPRSRKSQLAVLTAESGPPLTRYFGKWSGTYRRFTTNLSSAKLVVKALEPGRRPGDGIRCVLHWVDRRDMVRSDNGGVCVGDGWPVELWKAFVSELDNLPDGTVAEKLRSFSESNFQEGNAMVAEWRRRLRAGRVIPPERGRPVFGESWLPIPARLDAENGTTGCIVSWAPSARVYRSMSEAIASSEAVHKPDLVNQARYYLECNLAKLHGVKFGKDDYVEDEVYERTAEVLKVGKSLMKLERERIAKLGPLSRFDVRNVPGADARGYA
jgi:hypothetical protein